MEITINNKQYTIKYTLRALFIFEQITGKPFAINTLTDEYLFLLCILMANNKDIDLTFDTLIDAIDENPTIYSDYNKFMISEANKRNVFAAPKDESTNKKKH